ncbi:hypothetical protein KRX54_01920 [Actinomycetaceae bacterium TAE3-ERU4]|nr:hypothetical protein [Actinomycetaceae bacterium TAE3-ERU4]
MDQIIKTIFQTLVALGFTTPILIFLVWFMYRRFRLGQMPPNHEVRAATSTCFAFFFISCGFGLSYLFIDMSADLKTMEVHSEAHWIPLGGIPLGICIYLLAERLMFETVYRNYDESIKRQANLKVVPTLSILGPLSKTILLISCLSTAACVSVVAILIKQRSETVFPLVGMGLALGSLLIGAGLFGWVLHKITHRQPYLILTAEGDKAMRNLSATRAAMIVTLALALENVFVLSAASVAGISDNGAIFRLLAWGALLFGVVATLLIFVEARRAGGGRISPRLCDIAPEQEGVKGAAQSSERSVFSIFMRSEMAGPAAGFDYASDPLNHPDFDDIERPRAKQQKTQVKERENKGEEAEKQEEK